MKHQKPDLPSKVCAVCKRPFDWRRKWRDCWEDVKYCSERCRRNRKTASTIQSVCDKS